MANAENNKLIAIGEVLLDTIRSMSSAPLPTEMTPELGAALALLATFIASAKTTTHYAVTTINLLTAWCALFLGVFVPTSIIVVLALRKVLQNSTTSGAVTQVGASQVQATTFNQSSTVKSKKRRHEARTSSSTLHRLLVAFIGCESLSSLLSLSLRWIQLRLCGAASIS